MVEKIVETYEDKILSIFEAVKVIHLQELDKDEINWDRMRELMNLESYIYNNFFDDYGDVV